MRILKSCNSWFRLWLLLACALPSYAQEYILNGDFEDYYSLPDDISQFDKCKDWFQPNSFTSSDYFHTQGTNRGNLPNTGYITINPKSKDAIVGIFTFVDGLTDYREYVCTKLKNKLQAGKKYKLSFYANSGKPTSTSIYSYLASDALEVAFSDTTPKAGSDYVMNLKPTYSIGYRFYSETWVKITHTFVAKGDEQFMSIGNFKTRANTDTALVFVSPTIFPAEKTAYFYIDSVSLRPVLSSPKLKDTLCQGQSTKLVVIGEKNLSWYQMPQDSLIAQGDSILTVSPTKNTQYRAVGNSDTLTFSVNVQSPPSISYSDTTTCQPLSLVLGKTTSYDSLQVSPKTDSLRNTGTYLITAYRNGCVTQKSILYTLENCKEDTLRFSICEGDTLMLPSKTLTTHKWYKQTTLLQTSTDQELQVQPSTSTYYRVKGFSDYRLYEVTVQPKPIIPFEDQQFCHPFQWPIPYVSDTLLVNNQKMDTITKAGIYVFSAQQNGCKTNKTVLVIAPECAKTDSILHIPNAFSPNGDGLNDVWEIKGIQQYPRAVMNVYNRWGNVVYTSSVGYPVPWDGTRNGYPMAVGTYYYILELKNSEEETRTGAITIVR